MYQWIADLIYYSLIEFSIFSGDYKIHILAGLLCHIPYHSPPFQKMMRGVRDVAKKAGKNVDLIISGEDTELDKTVIDEISDPLIHLLRNAVDHGVESPEERIQKGKSEKGTVHLDAFHRGGNIVIEIRDNGRGLSKDKILKKAAEKGLIEDTTETTDQQIY